LPGERNPQSAAEEFAPPPQGENVLDASMMAELIVTKKEIAPQLKKSAGTSRAWQKSPGAGGQLLPLAGRHGAKHWIFWFLCSGLGRSWRRGSLPQFERRLKGRSGRTRRRGRGSVKSYSQDHLHEKCQREGPLASIWLAVHPCKPGGKGLGVALFAPSDSFISGGCFIRHIRGGRCGRNKAYEEGNGDRTGRVQGRCGERMVLNQAFNAGWVDAIQPSTKLRNALACNSSSSASVVVAIVAPV